MFTLDMLVVLMLPVSFQNHFVYASIYAFVDIFSENMGELDK